ncbi:histidine ammonia-lyase [Paradesulfitobacterium ferrireducens]|uniref:histidine ammonia-lyase n=1 Tax=Paradesulfitobacterium ferrireducens TaxID=2816476 RepID=UPI001A907A58|nr:histidine ammonia-lyase [Paradesulfitobacterium ferrireducens]
MSEVRKTLVNQEAAGKAPAPKKKIVCLDGSSLTIEDVVAVARHGAKVELSSQGAINMEISYQMVRTLLEEKKVVYGITTGFGKFSNVVINKDQTEQLQKNLIMSHATGVGNPLPTEVVRGIMLLRANALTKGYSGIRPEVVEVLISMLNKGVHPIVPEKGSVGSSGDLAPLSHVVLVMLGLGEAEYQGVRMPGKAALDKAGIPAVQLQAKEGLALINGTQVMTAIASLATNDALRLAETADIVGAMSVEALEGIADAFDEKIQKVRPHRGQSESAAHLRKLVAGSQILAEAKHGRVQDGYSLRCIPQVHGASRDAIRYVQGVVEVEINSVTDNPLLFPSEGEVISGGNFHGQPLALAMDFLGIALAELANISERRIERLVNPQLSCGLPAFLTEKGGLNSGYMIAQYTAASLVSENKVLAHPASVDSIPTSGNQEDHVSMGTIAARKARTILENAQYVLAIELLCAAQGIDLRGSTPGAGTQEAYQAVRQVVPKLKEDRVAYQDIETAVKVIRENLLLAAVGESA